MDWADNREPIAVPYRETLDSLTRRRFGPRFVRFEDGIRVDAARGLKFMGRNAGNRIPRRRIQRLVEHEPHSIAHQVGFDVAHHGPHDSTSDQHSTRANHDVNVQMCVGQQPRAAFHLYATGRDVNHVEFVTGS